MNNGGGASTASCPGEPSACGPQFFRQGTHLRPKKGVGGGGGRGGGGSEKRGAPCWDGLQLPLVLARHPLADPPLLGGVPI